MEDVKHCPFLDKKCIEGDCMMWVGRHEEREDPKTHEKSWPFVGGCAIPIAGWLAMQSIPKDDPAFGHRYLPPREK